MNAQPMFTPEVRQLSRLYMSRAKDITLDNVGRVLLPADTRKDAGLDKEVTLVGGGRPMFEVWDRTRFEEYERTHGDSLPTLFDKLSGYGV
jgi:MraZ protein